MKKLILPGLFLLVFLACSKEEQIQSCNTDSLTIEIPAPQDLDDGWKVNSLKRSGMNSRHVQDMIDEIESWPEHHFEGILIVKEGQLIFEKYFPGYDFNWNNINQQGNPVNFGPETRHFLASESKSVTSLLFGIAVDKGLITNLDAKIKSYYETEYPGLLQGEKVDITIRQLLTMSSGLSWDEWSAGANDSYNLFQADDPIRFILNLPLQYTPGTRFHYNSGGTNILGDLIHTTSGITLREFARQNLFSRLGITDWEWKAIRNTDLFASGGLYLRPRDMARIGQLVLNQGVWKGRRIISKDWIKESIQSRIVPTEFGLGTGYGYQWWLNEFHYREQSYPVVFSAGWGEQMMYIFPEEKTLILFFGSYYFHGPRQSVNSLGTFYMIFEQFSRYQ